jgi:hypothetical protein
LPVVIKGIEITYKYGKFFAELRGWEKGSKEVGRLIGRDGKQLDELCGKATGCHIFFDNNILKIKAVDLDDVIRGTYAALELREHINASGTPLFRVEIPRVRGGFGVVCGKGGVIKHGLQDEFRVRLLFRPKQMPPAVLVLGNDKETLHAAVNKIRNLLRGP